uniref:Cuticle protein n=1 Tax=Heliothis virescens TaxID=7102 RepID=A0A2A4JXM7_HELVI
MKFFVVAVSLFAVALSAPASPDAALEARRRLPALEHEEVHDEYGQFALRYVTAEGTVVSERGRLVPDSEGTGYVMIIEGETSYIGDDGKTYVTKYTAGLDGTHVEGNHLPVPVTPEPVPAAPVTPEPAPAVEPIVAPEPSEVAAEPVEFVIESFNNVVKKLN